MRERHLVRHSSLDTLFRDRLIVLVVAIAIAAGIAFFVLNGAGNDSGQQEGQAPYKTEEEMQAESEREIATGMFNISIASDIEFENASSDGYAYIENVPNNPYNMQVVITEDETGDVLYESGIITILRAFDWRSSCQLVSTVPPQPLRQSTLKQGKKRGRLLLHCI